MKDVTLRDAVWDFALRKALSAEGFAIDDIAKEVPETASRDEIVNILDLLAARGWLKEADSDSEVWHPGDLARSVPSGSHGDEDTIQSMTSLSTEGVAFVQGTVDRISGNNNVVVETEKGHVLGTHGPIGEQVMLPFYDGDIVKIELPRLRSKRAIVVRHTDNDVRLQLGERNPEISIQSTLFEGDVLPVRFPVFSRPGATSKWIRADDQDDIPLPLFRNVDRLCFEGRQKLHSEQRYAVEIESIADNVAVASPGSGSKVDSKSQNRSKSTSSKSLRELGQGIETVSTQQETDPDSTASDGWDRRRKSYLKEHQSQRD